MKELLDKTIVKLEANDDVTVLVFTTDTGEHIRYEATGDCCSNSWFSHFTNLKALFGNKINKVLQREEWSDNEQKKAEAEGDYDYLSLYAYNLETDKGTCEIEFRNDSNGYYGGMCELSTYEPSDEKLHVIDTDL